MFKSMSSFAFLDNKSSSRVVLHILIWVIVKKPADVLKVFHHELVIGVRVHRRQFPHEVIDQLFLLNGTCRMWHHEHYVQGVNRFFGFIDKVYNT